MLYSRFEATAILADYSTDAYYDAGLDLASVLTLTSDANPDQAIEVALQETKNRHLTLEEWLAKDDTNARVEQRVELQESFATYQKIARFASLQVVQSLPVGPLGRRRSGSQSRAFTIHTPEGEKAMLKMPRKEKSYYGEPVPDLTLRDKTQFTERRIRLLKHIPGARIEKALAASYKGSIVSSHVTGKPVVSLNAKDINTISDEHLLQGIRDVDTIARARIRLDDNGTNTTYDSERGFGFFDPLTAEGNEEYCLITNVRGFGQILAQECLMRDSRRRQSIIAMRKEIFERVVALGNDPTLPADTAKILINSEYKDYWHNSW